MLKQGVIGGIIKLAGVGAGFLFFLAVAQRTSAAQYGSFATAFSIATILGFSATGGQHVGILRFWPALSETRGSTLAESALWITFRLPMRILLSGLFVSCILVFTPLAGWTTIPPAQIMATFFLAASFTLSEYAVAAMRARGKLIYSLAPRELGWRILALAGITLVTAPLSATTALTVSGLTLLLASAPQYAFIIKKMILARSQNLPRTELEKIRNAVPGLWGVAITMPLAQNATTVVVAAALGPIAAGAYFAADRLARLLIIAMFGVNQIAAPRLSRSYHANDIPNTQHLASQASNIAFIAALVGLIVYSIFGKFALSLFNENYVSAYPVLLILCLGAVVNALTGANEILLQMTGRERRYFWIVCGWGLAGVIVAYFFSLWFGIWGAGIATFLALCGRSLHAVSICKREIGVLTLPSLFAPKS